MSETIIKQVDKITKIQRSGIVGLCQSCFTSGVELKLTEAKSNEIGKTVFPICEKCQNGAVPQTNHPSDPNTIPKV